MDIDRIGWAILENLEREGRIGMAELGRRVGLSAPAVAARVRRFEEEGVIDGYSARLNLRRLGITAEGFVKMSVRGSEVVQQELIAMMRGIPEILDVWRVTGAETYIMRVAAPTVEDLEHILGPLWTYGLTVTSVVMSHPVSGRALDAVTVGREGEEDRPGRG
jgi:Lrp/AsnC family leucine-responsive transcriptional regulator